MLINHFILASLFTMLLHLLMVLLLPYLLMILLSDIIFLILKIQSHPHLALLNSIPISFILGQFILIRMRNQIRIARGRLHNVLAVVQLEVFGCLLHAEVPIAADVVDVVFLF